MPAVYEKTQISYISPNVDIAVGTNVDTQSPISRTKPRLRARQKWQLIIDQTLLNWLENPSALRDIGVDPPSGTIIRLAINYAEKYRDQSLPAPDQIVADANGGIIFERRSGSLREVIYFWDDGDVEYQLYEDALLIDRSLF